MEISTKRAVSHESYKGRFNCKSRITILHKFNLYLETPFKGSWFERE